MSSNNDNNNIEDQPPPAKRQRRSLCASDRVVLDVGGTKFITSASTLTSNSAYFASLLSDNWIESNNGDDDEIFIDQDPVPFSVLLAYMRQGSIEIDDINTKVLLLAEFLGIERLLLAIKIRWYCNIGRGPVHTRDNEIASAFDQEYGGIMKAISSGLFPHFLKPNDAAEKEFAKLCISKEAPTPGTTMPRTTLKLKEVGKPGPEYEIGAVHGALNGLHLKGYTHYENKLRITKDTYTFSRRKHEKMGSGATDIFIPNNDEIGQERNGYVKQFAIAGAAENEDRTARMIYAPAEFDENESVRSNPLDHAVIEDPGPWLEDNGFVTRETAYEDIFREQFETIIGDGVKISIFSRMTSKSRDDASW